MTHYILPILAAVGAPGGYRSRRRAPYRPRIAPEESGKWIWAPGVEPRNSYIYARKLFKLDAPPTSAALKASADSGYRLYVNGEYVGQGPAASGNDRIYYDAYDVTSLLRKGDNVIAFLAHHIGEDTYSSVAGKPGLLCKLEMETDQGRQLLVSDETWIARKADDWTSQGARISKGVGFQEVYDSGLRIDNWAEVKLKERDWSPAEVVGIPIDNLLPPDVPTLKEESVYPVSVTGVFTAPEHAPETAPEQTADLMATGLLVPFKGRGLKNPDSLAATDGQTHVSTPRGNAGVAIILDFGREVSGNVEIGIAGSAQGTIDIGYAEMLEDGHAKPNRAEAKYTDRILLKKGKFEWRGFAPRAFRYLQMEFRWCSRAVAIDYVRVNQISYPVELTGTFECNDPVLNAVWQAGANTTLLCMQDRFVDSPRVERAQWWGDARILSRVAYYAYNDTTLLANGLKQFAEAQRKDGVIPGLYPAGEEKMVPDFAMLWVSSVLDYFAFSGDVDLIGKLYPHVRGLIEWFSRYLDDDGLLCDVLGDPFIDWKDIDNRGNLTSLNCLYHQALRVAAYVAAVAGREADAEDLLAQAAALRIAINKFLYHPKRSLYATSRVDGVISDECDPQSNVLAALCELTDQYQRSSILRRVMSGPPDEIATPYFASFVLETLYAAERYDEALQYIRKRWGPMVADGAGTLWEEFTPYGNLCQGWATSPTRDLIAEYVGIKPGGGAGRYSVVPHIGDLAWASGSVKTPAGTLSVSWKRSRNQLALKINVPKGVRVDAYPPGPPHSTITLNGREHSSRFMSLTHGIHQIKVTEPRPPKQPKIEEEPGIRIPQVEVLDSGIRPARRPAREPARRERTGRTGRKPAAGSTEQQGQEPAMEPQLLGPQMEAAPVEVQPEVPVTQAGPEGAEQPQAKPRRRRPRSSRGGVRHRKPKADSPGDSSPSPEPPPAE